MATRRSTPKIEVQHETSTRHDVRLILSDEMLSQMAPSDTVHLHLAGATDVQIKLSYSQLSRLLVGDPRQVKADPDDFAPEW